jgi:hypothetical protein
MIEVHWQRGILYREHIESSWGPEQKSRDRDSTDEMEGALKQRRLLGKRRARPAGNEY